MNNERLLRSAGIMSTVAAAIGAAADLILFYVPGFSADPIGSLLTIPPSRIITGTLLGVFFIPLLALGYWMLYERLKSTGEKQARPILFLGVYGAALGAAIHAFVGTASHLFIKVQNSIDVTLDLAYALAPMVVTVYVFFYLLMVAGSIWFIVLVLRSDIYPRWIIALSPLVVNSVATLLGFAIPPLGDVLLPSIANFSHVLLFGAATFIFWGEVS